MTDGWAIPDNQRVPHYFADGTSLCLRWNYTGATSSTYRPSGNHCRICEQKKSQR